MFSDKIFRENQNTPFMFNKLFPEDPAVNNIMLKIKILLDRPLNE
jgi:hypothetical protein